MMLESPRDISASHRRGPLLDQRTDSRLIISFLLCAHLRPPRPFIHCGFLSRADSLVVANTGELLPLEAPRASIDLVREFDRVMAALTRSDSAR